MLVISSLAPVEGQTRAQVFGLKLLAVVRSLVTGCSGLSGRQLLVLWAGVNLLESGIESGAT